MVKIRKHNFDFSDFAGYKDILLEKQKEENKPISDEQKQKNKELTDRLVPNYTPPTPKFQPSDLTVKEDKPIAENKPSGNIMDRLMQKPETSMIEKLQNQVAVSDNTQPKVVSTPDPTKEFFTDILAAPVKATLGGIVQGGKDIGRGMSEIGDTDILSGLANPSTQKQTLTGLTSILSGGAEIAFGAATPFVPAIAGFSAGSELANKVVPENVMKYANQPITALTNPDTQLGKNVANIGDVLTQLLLAKGGGKVLSSLKGKLPSSIIDRLQPKTETGIESQQAVGNTLPINNLKTAEQLDNPVTTAKPEKPTLPENKVSADPQSRLIVNQLTRALAIAKKKGEAFNEKDIISKINDVKDPNEKVRLENLYKETIDYNKQLNKKGGQDAIQESSTAQIHERQQEGVGESGSRRGGVEQKEQGQEVAKEGEQKQEIGNDKEVPQVKQDVKQQVKKPADVGLKPMVTTIEGKEVVGKSGDTHTNVIEDNNLSEKERSFVTPEGKKLNRKEAGEYVKENQPEIAKFVKDIENLHTEDYNQAVEKSKGISGEVGGNAVDIKKRRYTPDEIAAGRADFIKGATTTDIFAGDNRFAKPIGESVPRETSAKEEKPIDNNVEAVKNALSRGKTPEKISKALEIPIKDVQKIQRDIAIDKAKEPVKPETKEVGKVPTKSDAILKKQQGIFDLLQDMKTQDTPSAKRNFVLDAQKRAKELREQGVNAEVKQSRNGWKLYIDGVEQGKRSLGMVTRSAKEDISKIEVRPEAEKSFEELPEEKRSHQEIIAENFVEPSDLPKGMGDKGLKKGIDDIKHDNGREKSPEAKIVRNVAEDILENGKEIKQIKGSKNTEDLSPEDVKSFVDKKLSENPNEEGEEGFNFGKDAENSSIEDIFGDAVEETKPKTKAKKPEQLEMEGLGKPSMKGSEDYLKNKGKGEESTPLFKQQEGQKENLFEQPKDIKAKSKEIADKIRTAKIPRPQGFYSSTGADLAWNLGVETVAKAVEAGGEVAQAIKNGIDKVKETDWYKGLNDSRKKEVESQFADWHNKVLEEKQTDNAIKPNIEEKTSVKKRFLEAENEEMGSEPLQIRVREKAPEIFDRVKKNYNPEESNDLAGRIIKNPDKPISREQQFDLLNHRLNLRNERNDLSAKYREAVKNGDQETIDKLEPKMSRNKEAFDLNTQGIAAAKTTASDVFRDMQLVADLEKGTLENDLSTAEKANGGKPLSAEQIKYYEDRHQELQQVNEKIQTRLSEFETENAKLKSDLAIKKMARENAIDTRRRGRAQSKEELSLEWQDLNKQLYKVIAGGVHAGIPVDAIPIVGKMARNAIQRGIVTVEGITDEIHNNIKDKIEGVTKQHIMDAISGYGKEVKPNKDELTAQYNDVKSQMLNLRKLQTLEQGERPITNKGVKREPSPELKDLRKQVKDAMKEQGFTQEDNFNTYKKRLDTKISDLKEKIANQDWSKPEPKPRIEYPEDIKKMQGAREQLLTQIEQKHKQIERQNRTKFEKVTEAVTRFSKGIKLTGLASIAKLGNFSAQTMVTRPLLEAVGAGYSKIPGLKTIADQAPVEGGYAGVKTEIDAYKKFFSTMNKENMKDIWQKGETKFTALYGDKKYRLELDPETMSYYDNVQSVLDKATRVHTMMKEPLKQSTWERSYAKIRRWQEINKVDMSDPIHRKFAETYAYADAMRTILLNDNAATKFYREHIVQGLKHIGEEGSMTRKVGQTLSAGTQMLTPIVTIPVNYGIAGTEYTFGMAKAGTSIIKHVLDHSIKNLKPEEADYIMRNLKKGTPAAMAATLMYLGYQNSGMFKFGGYYQEGEKRDPEDVAPGKIMLTGATLPEGAIKAFELLGFRQTKKGLELPAAIAHSPILEPYQFMATAKQVSEKLADKAKKGNTDESKLSIYADAAGSALYGMAQEIPFVREPMQIAKIRSGAGLGRFVGNLIAGDIIPPDLGKVAKELDTNDKGEKIQRQEGLINSTIQKIPKVREWLVPEYVPKGHRSKLNNNKSNVLEN